MPHRDLALTDEALRDLLPEGVIRDYLDYWSPTTDAPLIYHVAGALATVAGVVGNSIFLPFGGQPIYPNLWLLILGLSSLFRKSTCVAKARATLQKVDPDRLLPNEFTRESLVRELTVRPQGVLTVSEFSGMLRYLSRDYMAGTKEMLADLYDCPESYSRLVGEQRYVVRQPCISILGASQTSWFLEKVNEGDIRGGFLARFIYLPAYSKSRSVAIPPEPDPARQRTLVSDLQALRAEQGAIELGPGVREGYERWIGDYETEMVKSEQVELLSPFWTRLSVITLKLAMLMQVARDGSLLVTRDTLDRAIRLTQVFKVALDRLFTEDLAFTRDMQNRQKVLRLIKRRGATGIAERDLLRSSNLLKKDLTPILDTLRAEEQIMREGKVIRSVENQEADVSAVSVSANET